MAFRRHRLFEMARMPTEDGLVVTLRPAVLRNHHTPTLERSGADSGHDVPLHRLVDEAVDTAVRLVTGNPRRAFKL